MDEANNHDEERPRASLKGKGKRILLGQEDLGDLLSNNIPRVPNRGDVAGPLDPSALPLTPEETADLLDGLTESFAYTPDMPTTPSAPKSDRQSPPAATPSPTQTDDSSTAMADANSELPSWLLSSDTLLDDDVLLAFPLQESAQDGIPLSERSGEKPVARMELPYSARVEVEALVPRGPEVWSGEDAGEVAADEAEYEVRADAAETGQTEADQGRQPIAAQPPQSAPTSIESPALIIPEPVLTSSRQPVADAIPADDGLLALLVDDKQLIKLSRQIEALEEELVKPGYGSPETVELHQHDLLEASGLLLASRENYDTARAIVYRIRAEMNRQRKTDADIMRYRPLLLNYYIGWGIALGVLFLLKALFVSVTDAVGVTLFAELYYPMLLGVGGALLSGYLTLERHTTRLRDFDPIHISWYLFNPLLGGVLGLLMFLLASIANEDLLHGTASAPEYAITYLLCVVAGMNQSSVLRQLNDLVKRFGRE